MIDLHVYLYYTQFGKQFMYLLINAVLHKHLVGKLEVLLHLS